MVCVDSLGSTGTGIAPARDTASQVAMKVLAGTITSSPAPIPYPLRISSSASRPLLTPMQCRTPQYAANSLSKASTS